jgi:hypothetical protein
MVAKEVELANKNQGTLHRSGPKQKDRATWKHRSYPGWIKLSRGMGEVVMMEVRSKVQDQEWQLMQSLLGFLDRHFADDIQAINIQLTN